jgi:hypothetical protein
MEFLNDVKDRAAAKLYEATDPRGGGSVIEVSLHFWWFLSNLSKISH